MTDVLVDVADLVAVVTLNSPQRRNAISAGLLSELRAALAGLDVRPDVRAVVLTGADPAFCAGLDLAELGRPYGPLSAAARGPVVSDLVAPRLGAINGPAVTGGLELALACDFLVASERARFADTHARIGVMPGWGLTVALPEAVRFRRAREMSATGNFIGARTALAWGLVNHVVPHENLIGFSRRLAADIASADPAAVRAIFATYDRAAAITDGPARQVEADAHQRWHVGGAEIAGAGDNPRVVLEATYGWYWAADTLAAAGAEVHLAHPLGVKAYGYQRVKTDARDAANLADLLRMGRRPVPAPRHARGR